MDGALSEVNYTEFFCSWLVCQNEEAPSGTSREINIPKI